MTQTYLNWERAELSMLKLDGKVTIFNHEMVLQPLRPHQIYKQGVKNGTMFVSCKHRFRVLLNTYISIHKLEVQRRKILDNVRELLPLSMKSKDDSQLYKLEEYYLLYNQQGINNENKYN